MTTVQQIRKRDGRVVPFHENKIADAINKAFEAFSSCFSFVLISYWVKNKKSHYNRESAGEVLYFNRSQIAAELTVNSPGDRLITFKSEL